MTSATPEKRKNPAPRRTQSERSEDSRRRIIKSAIRIIQKDGYPKANMQEIARGAKVTLGAVQHQFGTRQVLMEQIIDEVLAPMNDRGNAWPSPDLPLEQRAQEFIRKSWDTTYSQPSYMAAWSLFFGCKPSPALFKRIDEKQKQEDPQFFLRLLDYFPEIREHHGNPEGFSSMVFATLRGMAVFQLFTVSAETIDAQLDALTICIVTAGGGSLKATPKNSAKK